MVHSSSLSGTANDQPNLGNVQQNSSTSPHWPTVCQELLRRFLPCTSVHTQPDCAVKQPTYIPRSLKVVADETTTGSHGRSDTYGPLALVDTFLAQGEKQDQNPSRHALAILGEAGSGKTIFLQHFAQCLLRRHQLDQGHWLPIWLSPGQLKHNTIKEYLFGPWLAQAAKTDEQIDLDVWRESFQQGLDAGEFWLLVDGADYISAESGEIAVAQGPLSWLQDCLGELPNLSVLLSCRPETRRDDPKGLSGFHRYSMARLTYPENVEQAIEDCFTGDRPVEEPEAKGQNALAASLIEALGQSEAKHLRNYLLSPRRLMLCCRFWRDQPRDFPDSSAALYQKLTSAFYLWQSEWVETKPNQQKDLEQLLGRLARQILSQNHGDHRPLSQGDIDSIFGKNSSSFRLALQLGWLIPKGIVRKGVWQRGYGFADHTFRDYFAALAIADRKFFFDPYGHHYRIFAPEWQRVMAFWWGREDIDRVEKIELVQALLDFDDRCSPENFYGLRALEAAVLALREVPDLPQADAIVDRVLEYSLPRANPNQCRQKWASALLEQAHRSPVVQALITTLETTEDERVYQQCCRWLSQWAQGFPQVFGVLGRQLDLHRQSTLRFTVASTWMMLDPQATEAVKIFLDELEVEQADYSLALQTLGHCGVNNAIVIKALLEFLSQELSVLHHRQVLQCLEAVGKDNGLVIASLLQKLRTYPEGSFLCQIAESLEKIDPGNPTALVVLERHVHSEHPLPLRKQAIYSLGEVCAPSAMVVESLADLLTVEEDIFVRWLIVSSLAKIGQGHPKAIATLTNLVEQGVTQPRSEEGDWLLNETIQALLKIDPHNVTILPFLVDLLEHTEPSEHLEYLQSWAEILGYLDPGNPTAINTLLALLRKKEDPYIQRQAATSLATIDPGNLSALMVLINLLQNNDNDNIRLAAAQNLGQVGKNNPAVLAALIRTAVNIDPQAETLRGVVQALAQIGKNNKEVAQTFLALLPKALDDRLRQDVANALLTVVYRKLLPTVVYQLRDLCHKPLGQNHGAHWQIFWHCSQRMTYADFYQAWHQRPLGESSANIPGKSAKQWSFFRHALTQALRGESTAIKDCQVIWIDTSQFLNWDNPSVDIYDQMLDQNCPELSSDIPDNLSKLRLYWHQLQRKQGHLHLLIFERLDADPQDLDHLWQQLATFHGAIAVLGLTSPPKTVVLPYFQLRESQGTAAEILAWLRNISTSI